VLPVFKSIAGWWDSLPGDLKNLLIGAFVAQKASSWLFGGGGILGALGSLVSTGASKGVNALVPQNVFVVNWAMMGGVGPVAAAETVAPEAAAVAGGGLVSTLTGALSVVLPPLILLALASQADNIQKFLGSNYDPASHNVPANDLSWPWGPKNTPKLDIGPFKNLLGGDSGTAAPPSSTTPETPGGAGAAAGSSWNLPGGGTETTPGGVAADGTTPVGMTAADHTRLNKAGSAGRKDVLKQLHGKYNAGRAQADSTAITTDYTSGAAYNNSSLAANIATLVSLQKDAKEHGDPKTAALLGTNIQTLRDLLSGKTLPSGKTAGPGMGSTWHLPGGGTETSGAFTPQSLSNAVRTGFAAAQINVSVSVRDINNGQTTSTSWGAGKPQ
jgi:hypothetical protein